MNVVVDRYRINLKNLAQFNLIVYYLIIGDSFRMASGVLMISKERTGLNSIGSASEVKVTNYIRFICVLNLQTQLQMWIFLIAMDMSTHMTTSYLGFWMENMKVVDV